ncbi:hypothetical protein Q3G72_008619 [Acer saccharum]|nr:hypothetical protein Q3G72_008619 [Acer saccharum]
MTRLNWATLALIGSDSSLLKLFANLLSFRFWRRRQITGQWFQRRWFFSRNRSPTLCGSLSRLIINSLFSSWKLDCSS